MPDGSSLKAIPIIRKESPETQIVVLTMQQEPAFAREALGSGALGYVLKEAADDELVEAVRRAAAGESYLNPRLGARMASEPPPGPPDDLSEREVEVLGLIALGHTNAEIAEQLHLSMRTVESHRSHIQQKLRLSTRAELVGYALEHGLISACPDRFTPAPDTQAVRSRSPVFGFSPLPPIPVDTTATYLVAPPYQVRPHDQIATARPQRMLERIPIAACAGIYNPDRRFFLASRCDRARAGGRRVVTAQR